MNNQTARDPNGFEKMENYFPPPSGVALLMLRKNRIRILKFSFGIFWMLCLVACGRVSHGDVAGKYSYRDDAVQETLILDASGEYQQIIVISGSTYGKSGKWGISPNGTVYFEEFLERMTLDAKQIVDPPLAYSSYRGFWNDRTGRIQFGAYSRYFVEREKD